MRGQTYKEPALTGALDALLVLACCLIPMQPEGPAGTAFLSGRGEDGQQELSPGTRLRVFSSAILRMRFYSRRSATICLSPLLSFPGVRRRWASEWGMMLNCQWISA